MHRSYIYILIEVARRELDSRMLLATKLANKGYSVIVGEKNQILWNIISGKYPPGVIFDKCAQFVDSKRFETVNQKGFVYTVLDEEGLITNCSYFNNHRFSKRSEDFVAANFVTGDNLNKIILSAYPNAKNIVSGNPRYAMLLPEWRKWFRKEFDLIKKKYGSFVLIISSFNPYPEVYKHALNGMKEMDDKFKLLMESYLQDNKDTGLNFVLRPHPSDQPYNYDSIQMDDRFNIIPWIIASEYLINAKCTTSLEAFISGKRAYTWKIPTREPAYRLANFFADDLTELDKGLSEKINKKRTEILNRLLSNADSANRSFDIIVEKLEDLSFKSELIIRKSSIHKMMHFKNKLRFVLNGDNYNRIRQKFTKSDINYAYEKVSAECPNVKIEVTDLVMEINC
jgi:surface carbohydrate biosynthesis protein